MGYYSDQEQKDIISTNLVSLIEASGKDQKQIAIDLDINPPTFNQWVNGKAIPSITTLRRLASYFNKSLTDIVNKDMSGHFEMTEDEKKLVKAYRKVDDSIKVSINILLGLVGGVQTLK